MNEHLSEEAVLNFFTTCSNEGRWGTDDELGTLNYVSRSKRAAAARLVMTGDIVSLSRDLRTTATFDNPVPVAHRMLFVNHEDAITCLDSIEITQHGFDVTHQDAVGHVFFEGRAWNGRRARDIVSPNGMSFGSVYPLRNGIATRGVLLDVAAARGVEYLEPGEPVWPDDLAAAEERAGVSVEEGDAVVVRIGLGVREDRALTRPGEPRAGLTAGCVEWLHDRRVAVYAGDCVVQIPSPYQRVTLPLHMVGMVAMGLALLDNVAVEELARVTSRESRYEFLLVVAPLRLPGATGSPVNPLAFF